MSKQILDEMRGRLHGEPGLAPDTRLGLAFSDGVLTIEGEVESVAVKRRLPALGKDPLVNADLRGVATHDGAVTLPGVAPKDAEREMADLDARRARGPRRGCLGRPRGTEPGSMRGAA